jgi:dihydrofolate synthase / folylpolyglutamate synthase
VAIIETGLGGRLDATNVLQPALTIITDISFDHTEILGPTLRDIAGEKAGIIKSGVPMVIGLLPPEARRVIAATCRERKAALIPLQKIDYTADLDKLSLQFHAETLHFNKVLPSLKGTHQLRNAALVLKAAETLRCRGVRLPKMAVKQGIEHTVWAGRFQIRSGDGHRPTTILDVCHNPGGAAAFADTFKKVFRKRRAQIIIGVVKRKAHQEMIDHLAQVAECFWLVPLKSGRSVDVKELQRSLDWHGVPLVQCGKLDTAWHQLLKITAPDDIIAVIGSHYLVGEYLSKYGKE